jgi:Integrase zinc binding domain
MYSRTMKEWARKFPITKELRAEGHGWFLGNKAVVPPDLALRRRLMNVFHDRVSAGHPGRDETYQATARQFWWPGMKTWIADYVMGCAPCQQSKIITHQLHNPLYKIPTWEYTQPFQQVAIDLITDLPPNGPYDSILTIVNHGCSRAAIFLPCAKTITGLGVAKLYADNVYRWFGLPLKVISDRDTRFTSQFGRALTARLGLEQNLSTAFHPQTDGLAERKNQWIEQFLRILSTTQQDDWSSWLTM